MKSNESYGRATGKRQDVLVRPRKRAQAGLASASVCLGLALAAGGCASQSAHQAGGVTSQGTKFTPVPATDHVAITFVTYVPDISATASKTLTDLIDKFQAEHPNIKVTVQTAAATTGPAVSAVVQQDQSAGTTPDVVQVGLDALTYTATAFGAQDLQHVVGSAALNAEWGGDHPYATAIRALGRVNGAQYAIPWVLSSPVLFYNASLFRQAGLNPYKPPVNWTQVMDDALAIKRATGADGISNCGAGASSSGVDWCTQAIIYSAGGTVIRKNGKSLTFTNKNTVYALKVMQQLAHSGAMVNLSIAQTVSEFAQGKLAMVLNSSAAQGVLVSVTAGKYQVLDTKLPGFGSKPSVPTNSGSALSILATSPLQQRASWELIRYLTSDSAYTQITEGIGYAPLRPGLMTDPRYLASWKAGQPLIAPNMAQLAHIVAWQDYPGGNYGQIESLLEDAVTNIVFEGANAQSAMSSAQSQASALLPS